MTATRVRGARLPRKGQIFLNHILAELRDSGASAAALEDATPGITDALFGEFRAFWLREVLRTIVAIFTFCLFIIPVLYFNFTHQQLSSVIT
jgi:hypothetical protein